MIAFLGFISLTILTHVLSPRHVTLNTIFGALCVYILIGVMWAHIYSAVQLLQFNLDPFGLGLILEAGGDVKAVRTQALSALMYHSFVTLTTLGYGDIVPATQTARSLCILEAIVGQIFLVVLVAGLVGHYVSSRPRRGDEDDRRGSW
jgi:hypothetical protein